MSSTRHRVLIVDRAPERAAELVAALERDGFDATLVPTVDELGAYPTPTGVLVDLEACGSGLAWLTRLKAAPLRPVTVIVSDAPDQLARIASALGAGADDFVVRPIQPDGLALRFAARGSVLRSSAGYSSVRLEATPGPPADRYCPACASLVEASRRACPECGADRAGDEWPGAAEGPYPLLGTTVAGRYLLDRFVGGGSSGLVYRALDKHTHRHFAAKFAPGPFGGRTRQLVEREALAVSKLASPHIVPVYELHDLSDGSLLVVTEFVSGCTLDTLVARSGPVRPLVALGIARQVAQGLHEVHERGMVHRDVKPANLMVQELPAGGRFVRILDFGLVRLTGALERSNAVFGTPLYAAPEQLVRGRTVDRRADVYSLGLTLAFMLTGLSPQLTTLREIVDARTREPGADLLRFADELPDIAALAPFVLALTAATPAERPADMVEVVRRIDELGGGGYDTGSWATV